MKKISTYVMMLIFGVSSICYGQTPDTTIYVDCHEQWQAPLPPDDVDGEITVDTICLAHWDFNTCIVGTYLQDTIYAETDSCVGDALFSHSAWNSCISGGVCYNEIGGWEDQYVALSNKAPHITFSSVDSFTITKIEVVGLSKTPNSWGQTNNAPDSLGIGLYHDSILIESYHFDLNIGSFTTIVVDSLNFGVGQTGEYMIDILPYSNTNLSVNVHTFEFFDLKISGYCEESCGEFEFSGANIDTYENCIGPDGIYVYTYNGSNDCGDTAQWIAEVIRVDDEAPIIECETSIDTINCSDPIPDLFISAYDICTDVSISIDTTIVFENTCEKQLEIVHTATDECGNSSSCTSILTIIDTIAPNITCNETILFQCTDFVPTAPDVIVTDNCDIDVDVVISGPDFFQDDCIGYYLYIYTATDDCGNTSSCSSIIDVIDTIPPVFEALAPIITVQCGEAHDFDQAVAIDNCTDVDLTFTDVPYIGTCASDGITRIWTATDQCGNTASITQTCTVIDTIPPSITCAPSSSLQCSDFVPTAPDVIVTDNCDDDVDVVISGPDFVQDDCIGYYLYIYTATDDCGNTSSCSSIVDIIDTISPMFEPLAPTIAIQCGENHNFDQAVAIDNCTDVDLTYMDITVVGTCAGDGIKRIWTATDQCGNTSSVTQTCTVIDTIAPILACDADLTIYTNNECEYEFTLPPIGTSDCDLDPLVQSSIDGVPYNIGDTINGVGMNTIIIEYLVTDWCGNTSTCTTTVHVLEEQASQVHCVASYTVAVQDTCVTLDAEVLVEEYVSCCSEYTVEVSRDQFIYTEDVEICCDDTGTLALWVRVTNTCTGSISTCEVFVTVTNESSLDIQCPADGSIACDEQHVFGFLEFGPYTQCLEIEVDSFDTTTEFDCYDAFTRTWVIEWSNALGTYIDTCKQTITETSPMVCEDILWPQDITLFGCNPTIPVENPVVPYYECGNMLWNHSDQVFEIPSSSEICKKILRTWTVIDWCFYEPNTTSSAGICTYVQEIKIMNSEAPICNVQDSILIGTGNDTCSGIFTVPAFDVQAPCPDDNVEVTTMIDGTQVQIGDQVTLDIGCYELLLEMKPDCGLTTYKTVQICVEDKKAPVCVLNYQINVNLNDDCWIDVCADKFDLHHKSYDNCTDSLDLIYSFSSDILDTCRRFDCFDQGLNPLQVYVWDEAGNNNYCTVILEVQDNSNGCENMSMAMEGRVVSSHGDEMEQVEVSSYSNNSQTGFDMSNISGEYAISTPIHPYSALAASFDDHPMNGVSTLDLVIIQRHILGIQPLSNIYDYVAADINYNGHISAVDLVELRKLILGIHSDFITNEVWKFVDANSTIHEHDLTQLDTMIEVPNQPLTEGLTFIGIKTGDVNNSVTLYATNEVQYRSSQVASLIRMEFIDDKLILVFDQDVLAPQIKFITDDNVTFETKVSSMVVLKDASLTIISDRAEASRVHEIDITGLPIEEISSIKWNIDTDAWTHGYTKDQERLSFTLDQGPKEEFDIQLYPNPSSNSIYINDSSTSYNFQVMNVDGACIIDGILDPYGSIDITTLTSGFYILVIKNEHKTLTKGFIKN